MPYSSRINIAQLSRRLITIAAKLIADLRQNWKHRLSAVDMLDAMLGTRAKILSGRSTLLMFILGLMLVAGTGTCLWTRTDRYQIRQIAEGSLALSSKAECDTVVRSSSALAQAGYVETALTIARGIKGATCRQRAFANLTQTLAKISQLRKGGDREKTRYYERQAAQEALKDIPGIGDPQQRREALTGIAMLLAPEGFADLAEDAAQRAVEITAVVNEPKLRLQLLTDLAASFAQVKITAPARTAAEKALATLEETSARTAPTKRYEAFLNLALKLEESNHHTVATAAAGKSLDVASAITPSSARNAAWQKLALDLAGKIDDVAHVAARQALTTLARNAEDIWYRRLTKLAADLTEHGMAEPVREAAKSMDPIPGCHMLASVATKLAETGDRDDAQKIANLARDLIAGIPEEKEEDRSRARYMVAVAFLSGKDNSAIDPDAAFPCRFFPPVAGVPEPDHPVVAAGCQ